MNEHEDPDQQPIQQSGEHPPEPPPPDSGAAAELPVLEEHVEQLPEEQHVLSESHVLVGGEGYEYRVRQALSLGPVRWYEAEEVTEGIARQVVILQALDAPGREQVDRIETMLGEVESHMLPAMAARMDDDTSTYLVLDAPPAPTLADALAEGMQFERLVNALAQASAGVAKMHEAGWLHLGLRPEAIRLSRPVQLLGLEHVCRVGERPEPAFYIPGYSPPEMIEDQPPDHRADVYSIGAMLYRGITGEPVAETGADMLAWRPPRPIPGVPQVLSNCLGERDGRFAHAGALHSALIGLSARLLPRTDYEIAASTTIGLEPTRSTNQDAYGYFREAAEYEDGGDMRAVVCVADGMGGMAAGEVASKVAVRTVLSQAMQALHSGHPLTAEQQAALPRQWMLAANDRVVDTMAEKHVRGGCTLVIAFLVGRRLTIAHVGDCRIYRIRGNEALALTQDHSLAVALAAQGQISRDEVRHHPDRSMVTRSLGDRRPLPDHYVDTLEQSTGKATLDLRTGDVLLLCSDGLWEPVVESEMLDALHRHSPDLREAARTMLDIALERGAPDNATVALVRVDEVPTWSKEEQDQC